MPPHWRTQALDRIKPTPEEDARVQADAQALLDEVQAALDEHGWEGTPRIEGSLAKGTYLHGQADCDVFVAFPTSLDRDELVRRVHELMSLLGDPVVAYAEHPYAQGTYRDHDAEIVPCYDLDDPSQMRSAVDRTPFHTEHVKAHLDADARDEVRLLKAFLETAGCYGAEESIRGVSGYLAELFILAHGTFEDTLAWATRGFGHPVTFDDAPAGSFDDAALVVLDPVDASRNAAAAVARRVLVRFREAAAAFRADPSPRFFTPPPPANLDPDTALARCQARTSRVLAVRVPAPRAELEDPVHAQLRRAATLASEQLEREQVPVLASTAVLDADERPWTGWVLVEAHAPALSAPYLHEGPPADVEQHAEGFRERWRTDPSAAGDVFEDEGRLYVHVDRDAETLAAIVEPHLADANAGKVVDTALDEDTIAFLEGKHAIADAPRAVLGRLLDRRRPWER